MFVFVFPLVVNVDVELFVLGTVVHLMFGDYGRVMLPGFLIIIGEVREML